MVEVKYGQWLNTGEVAAQLLNLPTQTTKLAGESLCEHTSWFYYVALHHDNNTTDPKDYLSFYSAKMGIHWTIYIPLHEA